MRVAQSIVLTEEERKTLTKLSRGRTTQARVVLRAKIILEAAAGQRNDQIAQKLGCTRRTVATWRNRFVTARVAGILKDAPRGGRPPTVRAAKEAEILRKTTQEKPIGATHWSTRLMAKAVGVSKATVHRAVACPSSEAAPGEDLQGLERSSIRGETGGRGRVVSESAGTCVGAFVR